MIVLVVLDIGCYAMTLGPQEPAAALYYNDARPDKIFYQGLALRRLGMENLAKGRFHKLINYGQNHYHDDPVMNYFAVSLPDLQIWDGSLKRANRIHCAYMLALGYVGLGNFEKAERFMKEVQTLDNGHQGILSLKSMIKLGI